ncbi:MAG: DUF5362 domain-containing protein [Ignavibacteriales bacterium]|jgi:hypothetical protein|nr:MAG: hypothetical protein F9K26_09550 [Ignavibacteriaceae bacterium]MCZ2143406.1 DUF5362 domain-containing protein [Ignavibacteriales bacterium]OQY74082.1 MAG: hypothetical protein B6D45_07275 [Ignavibacteriales bacterium UTCHB3]MBV6444285.1 hypothetical protein [Ignavibacteriaceae bacterium]MBZ0197786.1 DUF5362 domain-containing protein [Ignavibacteriaceae bacterium]
MDNNYIEKNTISSLGNDAKTVGLLSIIVGAFNCITIFGLINGIIQIIVGLKAKAAGENFSNFATTDDEMAERFALENLGSYFRITKILIIIALCMIALVFILFVGGIATLSSLR